MGLAFKALLYVFSFFKEIKKVHYKSITLLSLLLPFSTKDAAIMQLLSW